MSEAEPSKTILLVKMWMLATPRADQEKGWRAQNYTTGFYDFGAAQDQITRNWTQAETLIVDTDKTRQDKTRHTERQKHNWDGCVHRETTKAGRPRARTHSLTLVRSPLLARRVLPSSNQRKKTRPRDKQRSAERTNKVGQGERELSPYPPPEKEHSHRMKTEHAPRQERDHKRDAHKLDNATTYTRRGGRNEELRNGRGGKEPRREGRAPSRCP